MRGSLSRPAVSQASARSIAWSASSAHGCQRVEVGKPAIGGQRRHQFRVGEPRGRIVLGEARDRAGLFDGRIQALLAQVRGAGAALALAEIDGDGDTAIAGRFDRLHRAHAHVDVEAVFLAAADLGLARAARAAAVDQLLRDTGQVVQPGIAVGSHVPGGGRSHCVQWLILVFIAKSLHAKRTDHDARTRRRLR